MKLLILISIIIISNPIFGQGIPWAKTHNWTLYSVKSQDAFKTPVDSLLKYRNKSLKDDSIHNLMGGQSLIEQDRTPVWMGAFVATYQIDDATIHKVIISQYGGFFFDPERNEFYLLKRENRTKWLDYFSSIYTSIK